MYWFRIENPNLIFLWIFITGIHTTGGWLIATHAFRLHSKERLLAGFGIGLVLYLWVCNVLGRWFDPTLTFVISAFLVLSIGIFIGWFSDRPWFHWEDFKIWTWILSGIVLVWVFLRVSKGTGMFDEYKNLALISIIANGEIPVREYFGLPELLRYHYGFHFWGASMMRLGGLMPWSAFDLSKSIIWGYTILLASLLGKRYIQQNWGALLMGTVTTLAGGTRYLMLLLPASLFNRLDDVINPMGISQDLGRFTDAMKTVWIPEAGPPVNYPFAFLSGINPPYIMAHTGSGTLERALLFLSILLLPRTKKPFSFIFIAIFLSFWALTAESSYVLICLGISICFLWQQLRHTNNIRRWSSETRSFLVAVLIAGLMSIVQGGTITAIIEEVFVQNQPPASINPQLSPTNPPNDFWGFSIRWPPAIPSAHLGDLPISSPLGITAALCEMGLIILFLPWLTIRIMQTDPQTNWIDRILLISAWFGIIFPIFIQWVSGRDITRLTSFGMIIITYLSVIYLIPQTQNNYRLTNQLGWLALALMTFSGIVLAGIQLTAAPDTIYSAKYKDFDTKLLAQVWGKIPKDSKIFGPVGKGSILTGRVTAGIYTYPPNERDIWVELRANPTFNTFIANGFEFVYFDSETNKSFLEEINKASCAKMFGYAEDRSGVNYAGFYDLRGCYPP